MKRECRCGHIYDESDAEEWLGLSVMEPGCPSCGSDDFLDVEDDELADEFIPDFYYFDIGKALSRGDPLTAGGV